MKKQNTPTVLSIVLPLYLQHDQITTLVRNYTKLLKSLSFTTQLLFVVNGPDDGTFELLQTLSKSQKHLMVLRSPNPGWGESVLFGMKHATGKFLCYTNTARTEMADLRFVITLAVQQKNVVVKTTRIVRESMLRKFGSTLYNIEARLLLNTPVWDINATPKVIPRSMYSKLQITSKNDLIDAEFVAECFKHHFPLLEVPCLLNKRFSGHSTTNFLSAIKMYIGLFRLRMKYDKS